MVINRERMRRQSPEKLSHGTLGRFLDKWYPSKRVVRIYPNMHFDTMQNSKLETMSEKQLMQAIEKLNAAQRQKIRAMVAKFRENAEAFIDTDPDGAKDSITKERHGKG